MRVCVRPGCDREIPEAASETRVYCEPRCRTAHWREKREKPKRVKPSGRQVSYLKAVRVLAAFLERTEDRTWNFDGAYDPLADAEEILAPALPERQRTAR